MSEIRYNNIILSFNRLMEYDIKGTETRAVLMGHPIYYLQNDKRNSGDDNIDLFHKRAAKALLLLHSMPFDYGNTKVKSFFNSSSAVNSGYEVVPYGFLALMGGLLYRKLYYANSGIDFVNFGDYKTPTINETFLVKNGKSINFGIITSSSSSCEYLPLSVIIKVDMDNYVRNKLIELFKSFVNETGDMLSDVELKYKVESTEIKNTDNDSNSTKSDSENQGRKSETREFDSVTFQRFLSQLVAKKDVSEVNRILSGVNGISSVNDTIYDNEYFIEDFRTYYKIALVNKTKLYLYYKEESNKLQTLFDKLYNHKSAVVSLTCQNKPNQHLLINKSVYNNMITGFTNTLKKLSDDYKKELENSGKTDIETTKTSADDDLKKSIYLYMKQFWDKWFCGVYNRTSQNDDEKKKPFSVEWFDEQFLFIDSFYNDVSSQLKLNCSTLLELYENSIGDDSNAGVHVYLHLANVAERHHCNFFCYPDFINFAKYEPESGIDSPEDVLSDLFKPMPYNKMNKMNIENQFVIIKTSSAQINGDKYQFSNDGFDIWTSDKETDIAPSTFKNAAMNYNADKHNLRMGYKLPAFGVAYSRQNNSIFKSIDVGMDTIQTTEQSIKSLCYISQLGNSNKRAVTFYGNDIYGVYSAYSYIVTVTMLGNAQIQPLMYFQLMNIPMFRGTYMIIEVRHSIKPGDFTTTFKGMKMSKIDVPTNESWFTVSTIDSDGKDGESTDC